MVFKTISMFWTAVHFFFYLSRMVGVMDGKFI